MVTTKKTLVFSILMVLLFSCDQKIEGTQTSFYVRGNCGMCEDRIEKAVKEVPGVSKADWDVKTKNLSVTYDSTKVNEAKIQVAVANSGHETNSVNSPQEVHDALPMCCKKGGGM